VLIAPSGVVLVHRVRGWEWDGYVGVVVSYEFGAGSSVVRRSYSLKRSAGPFVTETGRRLGVIVPPDQVCTGDAPN
jgi:hypothetical protein